MSIDKNIDGITLEDIENLITNEFVNVKLGIQIELLDSGDKKRAFI